MYIDSEEDQNNYNYDMSD